MQHNFLVTEHGGFCNERLRKFTAQCNLDLIDSIEVNSVFAIAELVKREMGLAFLPEFFVSKDINEGSLIKLDIDIESQTYYSQIICHKSRWFSPFMEGFIKLIKENRPEA